MRKLNISKLVIMIFAESAILLQGYSQDPSNTIGQVKIAAPNAASLGKFVDIPVNYHTGIPSINIPIYTIKSGSLELPISLSYHASGLKVQEQASWVGAGWALNAGGVITRTVRGLPDEKQSSSLQQKYGHFSDYGYLNYLFKYTDGTPAAEYDAQKFLEGKADGEPDLFFFNFNGYSGKFYFNDDRTPVLMPEQDFKIEYNYIGGLWNGGPGPYGGLGRSIDGFIITTPDGIKYHFGQTGGIDAVSPYVNPIEVTSPYSFNTGSTYSRCISSWYLAKVVSVDGEFTINLNYTADAYAYYVPNASNPSGNFSGDYITYDLAKNLVNGVKLSQISFLNGKVDFIAGAVREDLSNWNGFLTINDAVNQTSPALGAVQISDNTVSGFCKKYAFTYSYFTDNTTALPAFLSTFSLETDKKRLRLDYLQETICNGSLNIPPYHFEYFSELVPRTVSFGMDHWGFINGASNSDLLPSLTQNNAPYITTSVNRQSAWPAMRAGTLNKITFPTGGSNTYVYEPNAFEVQGSNTTVGGLRILNITQFDGVDAQKNIITNYNYNDSTGKSTSILYGKPVYIQRARNDIHMKTSLWLSSPNGCFPSTTPLISRNSIRPMESTQGYHLGYNEVKVSQTGNGSSTYRYYGLNPWEVDHTCVAVTNYDNSNCAATIPNHPAAPLPTDFKRGELKYEGKFNQSGNAILEKDYIPVYVENPVTIPGCIYVYFGSASLGTNYELKTARKTSNTIIEREYGISGQSHIETSTQTLFESPYHHQPTKTITTNSQGQAIEKRIKYSNEFIVASINNITTCNYQNYTNAVSAFPANYFSQLSSCGSTEGTPRTTCISSVWSSYLKNVSDARPWPIRERDNNKRRSCDNRAYTKTIS